MADCRVIVVGGGIIGFGSALRLKMALPNAQVTVIADKFTPNTTGDVAAGFLMPYSLGSESEKTTIRRWFQDTFTYLQGMALSAEADALGVGFVQAFWVSKSEEHLKSEVEDYTDILLNCGPMNEKLHALFSHEYKFGFFGTSIYAECKRLLPQLMKRFEDLGGRIQTKRLESLHELIGVADVAVNCTGIGAAKFVPDPAVHPLRGQVIKVRAPWIKNAFITDDHHILPNSDVVTLGGTKQKDNWSLEPNDKDREEIWKGCCKILPSLKDAEIIGDCVGLRPVRSFPRIEADSIAKDGKTLKVIHNYGHGGSGVSLFWGCANDVVALVEKFVHK